MSDFSLGSEHTGPPRTQPPLRGTQSLVGVMGFVWRHPSLTLLELLWRWVAALPLALLAWHALGSTLLRLPVDSAGLASLSFLEPVRSVDVLTRQVQVYRPALAHVAVWWLPCAVAAWAAASAWGRTAILGRAEPSLVPAWPRMAFVNFVRAVSFIALLACWCWALAAALHSTITAPAERGGEPNVVLLTAAAVGLTLLAFLLWSVVVWRLDVQPLMAMLRARRPDASSWRELRSKLIETNLVMGIVRVALLVLAMTFSASPLPFQSQQTQGFIDFWWVLVGLFYVLSSDFFHVVRRLTYLRLLESIVIGRVPR